MSEAALPRDLASRVLDLAGERFPLLDHEAASSILRMLTLFTTAISGAVALAALDRAGAERVVNARPESYEQLARELQGMRAGLQTLATTAEVVACVIAAILRERALREMPASGVVN